MKKTRREWTWAAAALLAMATALPSKTVGATAALVGGAPLGATLACIACAGTGLYAVVSGVGLAALLWTSTGFTASLACIGVCATALTT